MGFVDGSNPCPEKYQRDKEQKVTSIVSQAYLDWNRQDQNLLSWIQVTFSEHVVSQVFGLRSSRNKTIVDELSVVGHFIDESDQVTHILDGLLEEYDPIVMNVAAANQTDHVLVACVHGLLLNMKMRIARHRS